MTVNTIRGVVRIVDTNVNTRTGVDTNVYPSPKANTKPASIRSVVN